MTLLADAWVCAVPEVSREVPLVELRILGGLNLLGAGGRELSSVLAQPKRVALLAYLAAATPRRRDRRDRKSTRLNSSHLVISYAVFCLKKKKRKKQDMN